MRQGVLAVLGARTPLPAPSLESSPFPALLLMPRYFVSWCLEPRRSTFPVTARFCFTGAIKKNPAEYFQGKLVRPPRWFRQVLRHRNREVGPLYEPTGMH